MGDIEEGQNIDTNDTSEIVYYVDKYGATGKTRLKLYKAALGNNWKKAESIYCKTTIGYGAIITTRRETALHIAALAGHTDFVQNLVLKMDKNHIFLTTEKGNTAFHYAAMSGNVKTATVMAMDNETLLHLATARGHRDYLPIQMAAEKGKKEMVKFLYETTVNQLEFPNPTDDLKRNLKDLLITLIKSDIYDVALDLARELIKRDICSGEMEEEALEELALEPMTSVGFFDICIHRLLHRHLAEKSLMNKCAVELVQLMWYSLKRYDTKVVDFISRQDGNVILEAAKRGNFEFVAVLIASDPRFMLSRDENKYTVFHHAILSGHVEIFKLIHIGSVKTIITSFRDKKGYNMLHLAGKLPPPNQLKSIPGAALQLQRELLLFEEVKKVMEPHEANQKNRSTEIPDPHDVFMEEHKHLLEKGEKWMRDTANSCMIVSALITTIAFAAIITVPGGNGDDGYANFSSENLFKAFAIADLVSLVSSTTSLLGFSSILTSRYTMDDFHWSLPNKLVIGLVTLFVSVVAMMVAFVASFFIMFRYTHMWSVVVIVIVSSLPITLFVWQHFRLFVDVFYSTYESFLLFKTRKDPYLLIKGKKKKRKSLLLSLPSDNPRF